MLAPEGTAVKVTRLGDTAEDGGIGAGARRPDEPAACAGHLRSRRGGSSPSGAPAGLSRGASRDARRLRIACGKPRYENVCWPTARQPDVIMKRAFTGDIRRRTRHGRSLPARS
jgi:hypothetical protein